MSRIKLPKKARKIPRPNTMASNAVTFLIAPFADPVFSGLATALLSTIGIYFAASGRWVKIRAGLTAIGSLIVLLLLYAQEYLYEQHVIWPDFSATLADGRDWIMAGIGTNIVAVLATVLGMFAFAVFVTGTDVDDLRIRAKYAGIASIVLYAVDFILPFLAPFIP